MTTIPITLNDLAHRPVWVGWRIERRNDDETKVLYDPRQKKLTKADSTDPATWATLGEAETWAIVNRVGKDGGVGIVLGQHGDVCLAGIDLDTCRNADTETFEDWAQEVIDRFATYTEISPSVRGVNCFSLSPRQTFRQSKLYLKVSAAANSKMAAASIHPRSKFIARDDISPSQNKAAGQPMF